LHSHALNVRKFRPSKILSLYKNIRYLLYFSKMAIFYQPKPEQPQPLSCTTKYSSARRCGVRHAAPVSNPCC
jgi:hypothetical protein